MPTALAVALGAITAAYSAQGRTQPVPVTAATPSANPPAGFAHPLVNVARIAALSRPSSAEDTRGLPVNPQLELNDPAVKKTLTQELLRDLPNDPCGPIAARFQTRFLDVADSADPLATQSLVNDAQVYENACLSGPPQENDWINAISTVRNRVGVLAIQRDSGTEIFCGAYVLRADVAVTAKHCFFRTEEAPIDELYAAANAGRVSLAIIGAQAQIVPVKRILRAGTGAPGVTRIQTVNDYVFLSLAAEVSNLGPIGSILSNPPRDATPAYLAGFFDLAGAARTQPLSTATSGMRWSKALCAITSVSDDGCVYHTCQSTRGFSGSPIFAKRKTTGELLFAGLLTGANRESGTCVVRGGLRVNLAVSAALIMELAP
jgi:hypothetical protein